MSEVNYIPDGWEETTLGKLIYTNKKSIDKNFIFDKIIYLDTGSITRGVIESYQFLDYVDAPSRARRLVNDCDIVYSTVRPNQEHYGFIKNPKENLVVSTGFVVITSRNIKNSKFLYYWLIQNSITNYLHQLAEHSTTTYPSIKPSDIEQLKIILPSSINEQESISDILSVFENKIDSLKSQNETLEAIAQTIFTEWFNKYKSGDELPEGWQIDSLEKIANHSKTNIKPFDNPEAEYYHYSLPSYDNGLIPVIEKGDMIKSNKYLVENNSFLVSKLNPFTPRIWTIFDAQQNFICSTEFQVVKPKEELYFSLIHCFLNSDEFTSELSQKIKGTSSSHQRVNPQDIFDVELVIPGENDLINFNSAIYPLLAKKNINHKQIQTLSQTRDELLPRLMTGEIRVNEFNV